MFIHATTTFQYQECGTYFIIEYNFSIFFLLYTIFIVVPACSELVQTGIATIECVRSEAATLGVL